MKAAIVTGARRAPVYGDFAEPNPGPGTSVVRVAASAVSHVAKSRASGTHYSSGGTFPFVAGVDGAGVSEDGRRVYFLLPEHPFGAMAERCLVDDRHLIPIPEGLGDEQAAAIAVPGMSSWAALVERGKLEAGETVLVNGASGVSGRLAVQIAKHLGAKRVIATGRRPETFAELERLGADVTIPLVEDADRLEASFMKAVEQGVDIVLDYLWGKSAETLLIAAAKAGPDGVPIRYVEIGAASGQTLTLPSPVLRSSPLLLMGSGFGSVPFPRLAAAIRGVLAAAVRPGLEIACVSAPLAEVASVWERGDSGARVVLRP